MESEGGTTQDDYNSPSPLLAALFTSGSGGGDQAVDPVNPDRPSFNAVFNLDDEELNRLEPTLKQKLIENGENFIQQYDNLRIAHERLKTEYEQRFMELEADYTECKSKLAAELESSYLFKAKAGEFDDKIALLTRQVKKLETEKEIYISNEQKLNAINLNLEAEKRELLSLLDKKIKENDRLNEEWKSMNLKISESESIICELTSRNDEIKTKEASLTFREKQFESDKERLLNEIEWLNQQLKEKSTQLIEVKSTLNQTTYDLETRLELSSSELKKLQSQIESLQKSNESLQSQLDESSSKLQEAREKESRTRLEYNDEAASREKLIDMYKEEAAANKERLEEAARVIAEMNEVVAECKQEYGRLLDEKTSSEAAYEARIKCKEEALAKLEQELKNANELLSIAKRKGATVLSESDIEQLSPAAAVASRLLKSGMTLTQIYSEYVNLSESLQAEKNENERLKSYLNELVSEIEEKAPILNRQKQEYEDAMKTINTLSAQLENSMMDYEVLKSKSEDSIKKYNMVASENGRLKQDVNDLSRQVSVLLYEIEKLRARLINPRSSGSIGDHLDTTLANLFGNNMNESMNETTVGEVTSTSESAAATSGINKGAFYFRNIEDLQKQNQKLLRLINEMSDKKQSEEKAELEMRTKEFNEKLALAVRELDELKTQREKQETILEEMGKQRDMYKNLLFQVQSSKQSGSFPATPFTSTPGHFLTRTKSPSDLAVISSTSSDHQHYNDLLAQQSKQNEQIRAQLQQKLDETKSSFDKLNGQFDKYKEEMVTTNRMLREEAETYRVSSSEAGMKLALAESKLESALEKCKTLNTVLEKTRKELDASKEKITSLNGVIIKHESALAVANSELTHSRERVSQLETRLHSVALENDLHKSNYDRLSRELDIVQRENASRSNILSNLDMIRTSMERNEREAKLMYTQRIEQLEKENQIMKKQLEQDKEQHTVVIKSWQSQYDQLVGQRENEKTDYEKTRGELVEVKAKLEQLQTKYAEAEAKIHSNELILQMSRNSKTTSAITHLTQLEEESKEMKSRLSAADKEIVNLKIQLEDTRAHLRQYKHIAEMTEKNLRESNEAHSHEKSLLEARLNQLGDELKRAQNEYEETLAAKQRAEQEVASLMTQINDQTAQFEHERSDLVAQIEHNKKQIDNLDMILSERTQSRDDFAAKVAVLDEEVRANTQRLADVEAELGARVLELDEARNLLGIKEAEIELEKKSRQEQSAAYDTNERILNENLDKIRSENENLIKQNNLLQQELSKLGEQLIILRNEDQFERASHQTGEPLQQSASISNLLEINSYLRGEKEKLEETCKSVSLKLEISQQKQKTLENDVDMYRKNSQIYERQIEQLKQKMETGGSSSAVSAELMADENKRLRDEVESLTADNSKLCEEIRRLEDEIGNYKSSLRMSELKYETLSGSADCLKIEIDKWKNRLDGLMRESQYGEEWNRLQSEMNEAREQISQLSTTNADLTRLVEEKISALDQTARELNSLRERTSAEKQNHQREIEALRNEKKIKEEIFRTLVTGMRETIISVQKELELKESDFTLRPHGPERIKLIKDDLEAIKKDLIEKIKAQKEEYKSKAQKIDELMAESQAAQKKYEEYEARIKEKETKVGQLTNFTNTVKGKLQNQQKTIEDLQKQLTEAKGQMNQMQQHQQESGDSMATTHKQEIDALKMRFLQSQVENEKLKKELASKTTPGTGPSTASSGTSTVSSSGVSTPANVQTPTSSQTSSQTTSGETGAHQAPPTAYIAPSRITKVLPSQSQSTQSSQQGPLSLRRTAAVQPTPHETTSPQIVQPQRQIVSPLNIPSQAEPAQQWQQQAQPEPVEQTPQNEAASNVIPTTSAGVSVPITKRTREDEPEDLVTSGEQPTSASQLAASNSKKQRNNFEQELNEQEAQEQQEQPAEAYPEAASMGDTNDYIVINEEGQDNEGPDEVELGESPEDDDQIVIEEQESGEEARSGSDEEFQNDMIDQQQSNDAGGTGDYDTQQQGDQEDDERIEDAGPDPIPSPGNIAEEDTNNQAMEQQQQQSSSSSSSMDDKPTGGKLDAPDSEGSNQEAPQADKPTSSDFGQEQQPKRPSSAGAVDSQNSTQSAPTRSSLAQFSRNQTEPKKDVPKPTPIVWDGSSTSTAIVTSTSGAASQTASLFQPFQAQAQQQQQQQQPLRIRRPPVNQPGQQMSQLFNPNPTSVSTPYGGQTDIQQPSQMTSAFQPQTGLIPQPNPMRLVNTRPGFGPGGQPSGAQSSQSMFGSTPATAPRQQVASTAPNIPTDQRVLLRNARFQLNNQQQQSSQIPQQPNTVQQSLFSAQQQQSMIQMGQQMAQAQQLQQQQMRRGVGGLGRGGGVGGPGASPHQPPNTGTGPGRGRNF